MRRTSLHHFHGRIVIRIRMTDAEARRLEQAFLQVPDRKLPDRLQIVRPAPPGHRR
jgi:hypothetical protein